MKAVFAIPGDKDRRTGGSIYDATVLRVLNEMGCATDHMILPDSFPNPNAEDMTATFEQLCTVPSDIPVIVDGLVLGAMDPDRLGSLQAPIIAMIHHPLGLETGLSPDRAAYFCTNEAATLRHASHVIVPSPHTAEILVRDFGVEATKINVALPGFARPALVPNPSDPPLILSVGLLAERKGHDVLIAALASIQDTPWQAEIVGKDHDGATAVQLRNQVMELGLTDRIRLVGELSETALHDRYNAASIFALATRYEGYGMVLSEAMLYHLPVVSCAVGAVPDTVGDAGVLVPADDPIAFGQALHRLLNDQAHIEQLQSASRQKAESLQTWADTAQVFINVIKNLSAKDKRP